MRTSNRKAAGIRSKMATKYLVLLVSVLAVVSIEARKVPREELEADLRAKNLEDWQINTFVCLVEHESNFETTAHNTDTGDHGIFQISEIYWCSPPGNGCGMTCDSMRDDDIHNDVDCAITVYDETQRLSGNGFTAWTTYQYCH